MDYQGWMSADGYAGFKEVYRAGRIKKVICMTYVGGNFVDVSRVRAHNQNRTVAARAIADMKTFGHLS